VSADSAENIQRQPIRKMAITIDAELRRCEKRRPIRPPTTKNAHRLIEMFIIANATDNKTLIVKRARAASQR